MGKTSRICATATILAALAGHWAWAAAAGMSSDTSERLDEVTVTARRAELAPRVAAFVKQIAALENEEGLPRWGTRVCPLVSGLPRQEGEFVLGRVSDIAREAGVPLSGEYCRPNLFILVTADQARLHGMTLGQFADYLVMVGLAKLKPDARLGDAPTILTLFNAAPEAAPTGMTDWDQTFLKSLYATEQILKQQRGQIARQMVREIAP
jgi:hypothetical protein